MGSIGCGGDDGTVDPPKNAVPTIDFTFDKLAVSLSSTVELTVDVADDDGDALTVTWAVSRGSLTPADQGSTTMRWNTPGTPGDATVTATVSDGNGGQRAVVETLKVATLRASNIPTPVSTTWSLANSPYLLDPPSGVLSVIQDASLTIEAGVEVYVEAAVALSVEGTLSALGTQSQPVVFKPNTRQASIPFWIGILAQPNSSTPMVDLDHTVVTHAENAVFTRTIATANLDGCVFSFCSEAAVLHESSGSLTVTNSKITNNVGSGIRVERFSPPLPQSITIFGDSIAVNGRFADSTDYPDFDAGIVLMFNDPFAGVPILIDGNEISRNDFPGIRLGNPSLQMALYPVITNNGIFGNELRKTFKQQIRLEDLFDGLVSPDAIDATNNWWGQAFTDSLDVKEGIHDRWDSGSIETEVYVTPWLTSWPQ